MTLDTDTPYSLSNPPSTSTEVDLSSTRTSASSPHRIGSFRCHIWRRAGARGTRVNVPHSTVTDPPPASLSLAFQITPTLAVHLSLRVLELPLLSLKWGSTPSWKAAFRDATDLRVRGLSGWLWTMLWILVWGWVGSTGNAGERLFPGWTLLRRSTHHSYIYIRQGETP
ncbi:hypothetical protein BJY52DRAFT_79004 [Lactarius psammicola]|nr:hypothetical protein BJY52DRAFT_79004 [Lactarius psammicola]